MIRLTRITAGFGLLLASASAHGAINVQVNAVPDLGERVKVFAIVPAACTATVDCLWVEDRLHQDVTRLTPLRVVGATRVRQVMFEMEIETITVENRATIGRKLGVDSFLVARINIVGTRNAGAATVPVGATDITVQVEMAQIRAELLLISVEDGKKLLQGSGSAEASSSVTKNKAAKILREIVKKGFPKRP